MARVFKGALCANHLRRPGFRYGARACACLRRVDHPPPCRAAGRWEWIDVSETLQKVRDIKTGRKYEL